MGILKCFILYLVYLSVYVVESGLFISFVLFKR